ncbi:MAG: Uma2 family endonuclease [Leptospiraceae bacterium]|nr:Uma2 family endonuclease [Leptospiraceae bacterium]
MATISKQIKFPKNLPCDDGIPLETPVHRENMNILIDSAEFVMGNRKDFFAGGNMFLYFNPQELKNQDMRGPDFFLVKGVDGKKERKTWTLWEENWKFPDVIVELLSESTYQVDLGIKKELYEQTFHASEYYVYDPYNPDYLRGWSLNSYGFYEELVKNPEGWLWSRELNCWLGVWRGKMKGESKTYLRMYDKQKNLILLEFEREHLEKVRERERAEKERLEKEKERSEKEKERLEKEILAKKLRELGFDPDKLIGIGNK